MLGARGSWGWGVAGLVVEQTILGASLLSMIVVEQVVLVKRGHLLVDCGVPSC